MYNHIQELEGVNSLKTFNNVAYYCKNNSIFLKDTIVALNVECQSFWIVNGVIFFYDLEGHFFVKKIDSDERIRIHYSPYLFSINDDLVLGVYASQYENGRFLWKNGLFNCVTHSLDIEIPEFDNCNFLYKKDGILLGYNADKDIAGFSLSMRTLIWQFDLTLLNSIVEGKNEIEVSKFIGVLKSDLYVALNNSTIIVINICNGEVKHSFNELKGFSVGGGYFKEILPDADTFILDERKEILFSLYDEFYIQIDLKTNSTSFSSLYNSLSDIKIKSFRKSFNYAFDDDYIYTICHMDTHKLKVEWMMMCLVAINRKTIKIDWHYVFQNGINTDAPQLSLNRLYQLDSNRVLHVFEKREG